MKAVPEESEKNGAKPDEEQPGEGTGDPIEETGRGLRRSAVTVRVEQRF